MTVIYSSVRRKKCVFNLEAFHSCHSLTPLSKMFTIFLLVWTRCCCTVKVSFLTWAISSLFFFKMGQHRPLFHLSSPLQTNITILTTNNCGKSPSNLMCWDLNSRPSEHESLHITTRPGLPVFFQQLNSK